MAYGSQHCPPPGFPACSWNDLAALFVTLLFILTGHFSIASLTATTFRECHDRGVLGVRCPVSLPRHEIYANFQPYYIQPRDNTHLRTVSMSMPPMATVMAPMASMMAPVVVPVVAPMVMLPLHNGSSHYGPCCHGHP